MALQRPPCYPTRSDARSGGCTALPGCLQYAGQHLRALQSLGDGFMRNTLHLASPGIDFWFLCYLSSLMTGLLYEMVACMLVSRRRSYQSLA
jgi:hypothetical protein